MNTEKFYNALKLAQKKEPTLFLYAIKNLMNREDNSAYDSYAWTNLFNLVGRLTAVTQLEHSDDTEENLAAKIIAAAGLIKLVDSITGKFRFMRFGTVNEEEFYFCKSWLQEKEAEPLQEFLCLVLLDNAGKDYLQRTGSGHDSTSAKEFLAISINIGVWKDMMNMESIDFLELPVTLQSWGIRITLERQCKIKDLSPQSLTQLFGISTK